MSSSKDYQFKDIECPSCEDENAKLISHLMDIPYYDDFLMVNISCRVCGYKSSDFFNTRHKGYRRFVYSVISAEDDRTKVVKAKEATVSIPELGVTIEPLNDSTTWIRNIEGILDDIEKKLRIVLQSDEDPPIIEATQKRIALLDEMRNYKTKFTLIVEDPSGNSVILPAREENIKEYTEPLSN